MKAAIWQVVAATWLFSFVGLFAKLIPLSPARISLGRAVFAFLSMGIFLLVVRGARVFRLKKDEVWPLLVLGLLTSGNWYFYFLSIQASTVAVGVLSLFTYPLLTALMEPLFFRERYRPEVLGASIMVVVGVYLIVPEIDWRNQMARGVTFGLLAALAFALSSLLGRKMVAKREASILSFYQFLGAACIFAPTAAAVGGDPWIFEARILAPLILLGAGLTTFSQVLFLSSLKSLSSSFATMLVSLQPVYTILLAFLILNEIPTPSTIAGGGLILAAVGISVVAHRRASSV